jgi:phosphonate transport system substrate-binding protein
MDYNHFSNNNVGGEMKNAKILLIIYASYVPLHASCINFGVIPYGNIQNIKDEYSLLQKWLKEKDNLCLNVTIPKNYSQTIEMISKKELDCARMGPFSYILASRVVKLEPLVVGAKKDGSSTYHSVLATSKRVQSMYSLPENTSGFEGLQKIFSKIGDKSRDLIVGFTDEGSTSGYLIPSFYLSKAKLSSESFKKSLFLGTHEASQLALKSEIVDLSFSNDKLYKSLQKDGVIDSETNTLLWVSDPIPDSPIVCRNDIDDALKQKLKLSLLHAPYSHIPKYGKVAYYKEAKREDYKIIEEIQNYLDSRQ